MISHVHIQNFRCLRDLEIDLEPLTVFVGPNASGKSSILDALDPTARLDNWRNKWKQQRDLTSRVEFISDNEDSTIRVSKAHQSATTGRFSYQKLHLDLGCIRQSNTPSHEQSLATDGGNLTNVFASLTRKEQIDVASALCELVPVFGDVDFTPVGGGKLQLRFHDRWQPDVFFTPGDVSDGTMLMLAFLTLQYQKPPVDLVAIEEPERALHPYLMGQLMQFLRDLAHGEIGPAPMQVVLATHSAELLDHVRPEEVRFVDRDPDEGATFVRKPPVDTEDWDETMEVYTDSLGSAWLSGGLGGVPGR
ncbi:MAG: AAA family ATPase [Persicimonas sp.]